MTDENNQNNNESQKPESKNKNEEIPLWLQGLQQHEDENTNPVEVDASSVETWVSEVSKDTQDEVNALSTEAGEEKEPQTASESYPDWLTELSEINSGEPIVLDQHDEEPSPEQVQETKDSLTQDEESGEVEIEQIPPGKRPEEVDEGFEEPLTTKDEIAQSELAEVEITESIDKNINEEISQDEELPTWLQEMISEPQAQNEALEERDTEIRDEPTEPVELSGGTDSSEDIEPLEEEIKADEWADMEEESEKTNLETEFEQERYTFPEYEDADVMKVDQDANPEQIHSEWVQEDIVVSKINLEEEHSPTEAPTTIVEGDTQPIDLSGEMPVKEVNQEVQSYYDQEQIMEEGVPGSFQQEDQEQIMEEGLPGSFQQEDQEQIMEEGIPGSSQQEDQDQIMEDAIPGSFQQEGQEQIMEDAIPGSSQQEDQDQDSLPENLQEALDLLSRNEIDEAVERIRASDNRSTYSQELQYWLLDASKAADKPDFNFWELLGDIALENEDHDLAFNAYAKAVKSLLRSKEENDEIG